MAEEGKVKPAKDPEITRELGMISEALTSQEDLMQTLNARLGLVATPEEPPELEKDVTESNSPIGGELRAYRRQIQASNQRIGSLIGRLEL